MANQSSITLLSTIEWCKRFIFGRRLGNGNNLEPALTSANIIKSTILSPPFSWRWNRIEPITTFTCNTGQTNPQDYPVSVNNFGWIESATVQDLASSKWWQLEVKTNLERESSTARPRFISAQSDDLAGNITFRLMPSPDQNDVVNINIQQQSALFTSLQQTWSPIPDYLSYIYNWGFLSLMWLFNDDARFGLANQKFVSALIANNGGLTESQINIFLNNWQAITGTPITNSQNLVQSTQQRAV